MARSCAPIALTTPLDEARRRWLRGTGAVALVAGLAGCGFHLRGPLNLPFTRLRTNLSERSELGRDWRAQLEASGVRLEPMAVAPGQIPPTVDAVLEVLSEQRERIVVGMTATGQLRELLLRVRLRFRLRTPGGRDVIPDVELVQEREQTYDEALVLGKEQEETLLYRDMQTDIVRQAMRRLAAVKGL